MSTSRNKSVFTLSVRQVWVLLGLLTFSVCLYLSDAAAQDVEDGAPSTSSSASEIGEPPPIKGAWYGSAMDTLLLEEGVEVGRPGRWRSPWSSRYYGLYTAGLMPMSEGVGQIRAYNYLSLDYRLSWMKRLSLRPEFFFNTAGRSMYNNELGYFQDSDFSFGDMYVQYSQRELALIPTPIGEFGLFGAFRAYIPLSDASKRQRWVTKLNARLAFQMPLGNGYWIQYHLRSLLPIHTQQSYMTEFFNVRANEAFRLENWLQFSKFFAGTSMGIHQQFYVKHRWYHGSQENSLPADLNSFFGASTQASFDISGVFLQAGLTFETMAGEGSKGLIYNLSETSLIMQVGTRL